MEDGSARKFILKLAMRENISVYFHEFNASRDIWTEPPTIVFDTSEELLGNSMVHCFIETTHSNEASFYMKSRNCVDVVTDVRNATSGGIWTLKCTDEDNNGRSSVISSYLETDEAKVWHSGSSTAIDVEEPYIMFDKMKNAWIVADKEFGFATAWQSADAKELMFPTKRAKAVWTEA